MYRFFEKNALQSARLHLASYLYNEQHCIVNNKNFFTYEKVEIPHQI